MKLTQSEILKNKAEAIALLQKINRPGIQDLIAWLEYKSDFFEAPSSTVYHGCYEGGLCQHSLNVYHALHDLVEMSKKSALPEKQMDDVSEETIIIVSLMHDLCKANFYQKDIKVFKDEATQSWKHYYGYKCVDGFPVGHGEKSVIMLQNFIKLSCTEILAIRWHMGLFDVATTMSPYERPAYSEANNKCPILVMLQLADYYASHMMEYIVDPKVENVID